MTAGRFRLGRPRSLQGQLVLWLLPLHLLMTAGLGWLFADNYRVTIQRFMDGQMRALVQANAARNCDSLAVPPPQAPVVEVLEGGEFVVQLWCRREPTRQVSSLAGIEPPWQGRPGWHALEAGGVRWRALTGEDAEVRVQVLQSQDFRDMEVTARAFFASLVGLLLLPVSLGVLGLVVGRVSRRLRRSAEQLARQDEHHPAPAGLVLPCEIAPLAEAFEGVLARLRGALASQRRFVQDAAHELRTPLTALRLQLENLSPHLQAAGSDFEQLQQGMRRASHLVDQMLSLSRQDLAPSQAPQLLDLRELLRASIALGLVEADRRGVEMGFADAADGPVLLSAVEGDLRSLFDNLISNALRHTPAGGDVELRLTPQWVDIVDSGPGLPEGMRERVFDRFFRMPDAPPGGSGLGLAIARQAGLRHGLRIELRGREDGLSGLVARVHLP